MKCPNCKETRLLLSERKGIEIDYCPDCRGIWLDRGELDKLLEQSREALPRESREARDDSHQHSGHSGFQEKYYKEKHYRRKKSFLEELFD